MDDGVRKKNWGVEGRRKKVNSKKFGAEDRSFPTLQVASGSCARRVSQLPANNESCNPQSLSTTQHMTAYSNYAGE